MRKKDPACRIFDILVENHWIDNPMEVGRKIGVNKEYLEWVCDSLNYKRPTREIVEAAYQINVAVKKKSDFSYLIHEICEILDLNPGLRDSFYD